MYTVVVTVFFFPFLFWQDFRTYLNFCAIGLLNAQLLDQSFTLSRQLQV